MSFKNISQEEYDRLVKNKNRIFDLTFKTPERINKYRHDKNIYDEIKYNEKQNKKYIIIIKFYMVILINIYLKITKTTKI